MRFCDLARKEVINVNDCKCLGNVRDLDFDECDGCIKALIVPGPAKWMGCMGRDSVVQDCENRTRHHSGGH